jgi:hypothetical protein
LLNSRQEQILLSLKKLDFLNRSQLQRLHRLGGVRNTNKTLKKLSPWLHSYREGYESIYFLNPEGREYVHSEKVRRKNQFVNHVIMRNEMFIHFKCPVDWKNEIRVSDGKHSVICDALFTANLRKHFLEVDSIQKMKVNREKIEKYTAMRAALEQKLGYFPTIVWLTTTELRRKQLQELCKDLPSVVYTLSDIH